MILGGMQSPTSNRLAALDSAGFPGLDVLSRYFIRERHGGVEKRGGWKTSRMTPLPKKGFWTPLVRYVFHPPSGVSALFFLYKNPRQSRPEALLEGSKSSPHITAN